MTYDPAANSSGCYDDAIDELRWRKECESIPAAVHHFGAHTFFNGDMLEVLPALPENSIDSAVTDPPYHLQSIVKRFAKTGRTDSTWSRSGPHQRTARGFMNKEWDGGDIAMRPETWAEVFRALKPGAYLIALCGTRTEHRVVCAIEDAGFEIRDRILWLYSTGFPKNHAVKNHTSVCSCSENAVPYDHDKEIPEHDLRSVRGGDLSSALDAQDECREVLFESLPKQGSSCDGAARAKPETGARKQPRMEGRPVHRAGQGLCDGADAGPPEGSEERLRVRAHTGGGGDAGTPAASSGRGSPPESGPGGQPATEPESVCEPSGALDGGALPGRGVCARCGGLRQEFVGFGTALKPAVEIAVLARKPLAEKTVAANVQQYGTGALNIDGCRVGASRDVPASHSKAASSIGATGISGKRAPSELDPTIGRWPANVIHDGSAEVVEAFPETGGEKQERVARRGGSAWHGQSGFGSPDKTGTWPADSGGSAARFFYSAKATKADRLESKHPTVKPVDLIAYLCRLITPPGGTVLDPFAGSGTTGMACIREGFRSILIEREAEYFADIKRRVAHVSGADCPLFAELDDSDQIAMNLDPEAAE